MKELPLVVEATIGVTAVVWLLAGTASHGSSTTLHHTPTTTLKTRGEKH